ncbi:MAG: hypothetical protein ACRBFS_11735 [Aureispira sp.]
MFHPATADKENYSRSLLRYPKERIISILIQAAPLIPPFDAYAGYALEFLLEKLTYDWKIKLPDHLIRHALRDTAFRIQRLIISYVIDRNLVQFKVDLATLVDEEEIYEVELALEYWS